MTEEGNFTTSSSEDAHLKNCTSVKNFGVQKGGALQQLNEFLNSHTHGNTLSNLQGNTPTIPINDLRGDESIRYTREERLLRCRLSSLCRLIDLNGWTQSIYNHISAKMSHEEYLVNPFGLLYHEVQASSLIKLNKNGSVVDSGSTVLGVNNAGWRLHSAVHGTRDDINCVTHIHLPDVVAVSCIKSGLLPVSPEAATLLPTLRYHNYTGLVTDSDEAGAIRNDLGTGKVLFLRNRGVVIAASTIPEAWYLIKSIISACQTQMRLLQLGCGLNLLNEFIVTSTSKEECLPATNGDAEDNPPSNEDTAGLASLPSGVEEQTSSEIEANDGARSTSSGVITDVSGWGPGEMDFEAQMRMLDSAGYRTGYVYRNPNLLRRPPAEMPWSASPLQPHLTEDSSATGFLSDTTAATVGGEAVSEAADDVTMATRAGVAQMARITDNVRSNKEKGFQRNHWLSNSSTGGSKEQNGAQDGCVIDEPRTPPTPRSDFASRSASLPAHKRNKVKFPARSSNTLEPIDGALSDNEEHKLKSEDKKQKTKWNTFRFPTFRKKHQPAAPSVGAV